MYKPARPGLSAPEGYDEAIRPHEALHIRVDQPGLAQQQRHHRIDDDDDTIEEAGSRRCDWATPQVKKEEGN